MSPLILFDFDGVLADSLTVFHAGLAAACAVEGYPQLADREIFLRVFDGNLVAGMEQAGIPGDKVAPILADLGRRLGAALPEYPPFPGIRDALPILTAACPVYIITSNLTDVVWSYLKRYEIEGVRDVLGSDKEASKQAKIRSIADQWPGRQPVYVGDTLGDLREAHAAGVTAVAAGWGWHEPARLQRGRPHQLLRNPDDLLRWFAAINQPTKEPTHE